MATVFKAFQPSLQRYVAIKVLPPYFAHEPGFAQRFVREARAVAQLEHPHILPVYDYGQDGDYAYIVLKYVPTGTLQDRIDAGTLSLEQSVDIACQVAEALENAHRRGIIHRDVKPSNVLLDQEQWALLTDFGLARMVEGSTQLTASGVGVGTPDYMAPEQGQGRKVDGRADIYALGVVLFEMLTGRVPYEAETPMAVVLKHITDPLPLPRTLDPSIPESVEAVILRALAKNPDDRYATAGEMAVALRLAASSVPAGGRAPQDALSAPAAALPRSEETAPVMAGVSYSFQGKADSERQAVVEQAGGRDARREGTKRSLPRWVMAIGVLAVLVLVGIILVATGAFRSLDTAPEPVVTAQTALPTGGIVVDNRDPAFFIEAGEWGTCDDGACQGVSYGADFRYADPGCTTCRARFELRSMDAGEMDLWTWWPRGDDRATDTPFTIQHGSESLTVRVDQRQNGSEWVRLATLSLQETERVRVLVHGSSTGYANADAVALTEAGTWQPDARVQQVPADGIVVDNRDPGFSIVAGEWTATDEEGNYGVDFVYALPECVSCQAQFEIKVVDAGAYDLWAWWPKGDERATDTPFTIRYGDGSLTVNVDQRHNGTSWHPLATLSFGTGESVQIVIEGTDSGYANADAVALTPAGSWTSP
jgi:hypothetical protein